MKAILISIKPKWVAKILNGEKTIEVRKKFPEHYEGWVYIYCTKTKILGNIIKVGSQENSDLFGKNAITGINKGFMKKGDIDLQGKVVARFYCDRVWVMGDNAAGCWDYSKSIEENHKTWRHHYELGFVSHKYLHKYDPILDDDANTYSREYGSMLRNESCLSQEEIYNYLNNNKLCMHGKKGYAIHINDLEIFDKPKELWEFETTKQHLVGVIGQTQPILQNIRLTNAPQNFCYVEVE